MAVCVCVLRHAETVKKTHAQYTMSPLSMARKLAVAANAQKRVVSAGLKICPITGCSCMPTLPNFLFSIMSSVSSRTSSFLSSDMKIFRDVKLDAPVSRMISSACFRPASYDIPTPSCQESFLFQYLYLLRLSWFVPKYCGVDFLLGLQLVSHPNKIHWFS